MKLNRGEVLRAPLVSVGQASRVYFESVPAVAAVLADTIAYALGAWLVSPLPWSGCN